MITGLPEYIAPIWVNLIEPALPYPGLPSPCLTCNVAGAHARTIHRTSDGPKVVAQIAQPGLLMHFDTTFLPDPALCELEPIILRILEIHGAVEAFPQL